MTIIDYLKQSLGDNWQDASQEDINKVLKEISDKLTDKSFDLPQDNFKIFKDCKDAIEKG